MWRSTVSRKTNPENLQCCCSTDAETGFVPASAQFFAVSTLLTVRSSSCPRSCTEIFRVSMCFVRGPAPNRSVTEFATKLSHYISNFIGIPKSMYTDLKDSPTWLSFTTAWNSLLLLSSKLSSSAVYIQISVCDCQFVQPIPSSRLDLLRNRCPRRL